jgi:hypothetical protein
VIRDAAVFSLNEIALKPDGWPIFETLLEEDALRTEPPMSPGVYLLALPRHYLSYPGGSSRVFYIGRATGPSGIRKRLTDHYTATKQRRETVGDTGRYYARYEWAAVHGIQGTWSEQPDSSSLSAVQMEQNLLYWFAELYGAAPLGNAQSAWAKVQPEGLAE